MASYFIDGDGQLDRTKVRNRTSNFSVKIGSMTDFPLLPQLC